MSDVGPSQGGSIAMEHIIHSEILAVTSAMRRNYRWASFAGKRPATDDGLANTMGLRRAGQHRQNGEHKQERQEAELWASFEALKRKIRDTEDVLQLPLPEILDPFLALIRSPLSTGPITSVALSSLSSFLETGLVFPTSVALRPALSEISNALAKCKFEASDVSSDEVVTLRILNLIKDCILKDVGSMLGDFEICEMIEPVLTTCCQMRLSEILRRSASAAMHALARRIFSRLRHIDPVASELEEDMSSIDGTSQHMDSSLSVKIDLETESSHEDSSVHDIETPVEQVKMTPSSKTTSTDVPYGLPAITELLRVLINLLDPDDKEHTDSTRLIALSVLNTVFEVSGHQIVSFSPLKTMVRDRGCKFLFLLARSENPSILYSSLRAVSAMLETMRSDLKLQQELFISFTLDRLAPPPMPARLVSGSNSKGISYSPNIPSSTAGTPVLSSVADEAGSETSSMPAARPSALPAKGETRELLLQTLNHLSRSPSFMVDLYVNYDCDINCENLSERLITFVTKGIYPSQYTGGLEYHQQSSQAHCLDLVLTFVQHMARRVEGGPESWPKAYPPIERLLHDKSQKQLILTGALRFNAKPKLGISFLEENKLIYADGLPPALSLAKFLRMCPRMDKKLLGDFLSRPENLDVLGHFMGLLDFKGNPVAEAMRNLLEAFRLPGESQQIARITETFASKYFATQPEVIKTEDAVYVLAYSIIMLNTDLHNPQVRKRMTLEDYQRNLRGVNDGSDFPASYLQAIYESIRKREIVMPEEHIGQVGFEYAWKELLSRSQKSGKLIMKNTSQFDQYIFKLVWKQVIPALGFAFTYYDDDYIVQRAISGFQQCATLATHFGMPEVFDHIVLSVSPTTGLLDVSAPRTYNFPTTEAEGQTVSVTPLSVHFGGNLKGQLAAIVLFRIVNGNARTLREGWKQMIEIYLNLFLHSMLPAALLEKEQFLGGTSAIPLQGTISSPTPVTRPEAGLLSALSSYLMTPYGSTSEPILPQATQSEIENALCAVDCVSACRIDEFYEEIMGLGHEALVHVLETAKALLETRVEEHLTDADAHAQRSPTYDPGVVFILEVMLSASEHGQEYIYDLWPIVFGALQDILSRATSYSTLLVERAVVGLTRLCSAIVQRDDLRDQLFIAVDVLGSLPAAVVSTVGDQVISGVVDLLKGREDIIRSNTEWTIVTNLVRNTISHPTGCRHSFAWIDNFLSAENSKHKVSAESFIPLLAVLQEYAELAVSRPMKGSSRRSAPDAHWESVSERGYRSVNLMFEIRKWLPQLYQSPLSSTQVWVHYALPLLVALARQCTNSNRELRHLATQNLQRIIMGPSASFMGDPPSPGSDEDIFNQILFPLVDDLLKAEVMQRDHAGMAETRLRACSLLCRAFLQYEIQAPQEAKDVKDIWLQILDLLEHLMNVNIRDPLHEAVPESLKNVALVMYAAEYLVPPPTREEDARTDQQKEMWIVTNERLQRFLPGFLDAILGQSRSPTSPPVQSLPLPNPPQSPMPTGASTPLKPKSSSIL